MDLLEAVESRTFPTPFTHQLAPARTGIERFRQRIGGKEDPVMGGWDVELSINRLVSVALLAATSPQTID
jgi:hypothetical protein